MHGTGTQRIACKEFEGLPTELSRTSNLLGATRRTTLGTPRDGDGDVWR